MKILTFLDITEELLRDYPPELRKEMIDDLYEWFQNELTDGKSEEEATAMLGTPQDTADSLRMMYGDPNTYRAAPPRVEDQMKETWKEFTDFVEGGFREVRRQIMGDTDEPVPEAVFCSEPPQIITVLCYHADLTLQIESGRRLAQAFWCKRTLFGNDSSRMEMKEKNHGVVFRILARDASSPKPASLVLEIPPSVQEIQIENRTGDTVLKNLDCSGILCRVSRGTLQISNTKSDTIAVQASNTEITLNSVTTDTCYVQTTNTPIRAEYCKGALELRTKRGDIETVRHSGLSFLSMSTKGNQVIDTDALNVTCESTSGKITLNKESPAAPVSVRTRSGKILATLPERGWFAHIQTSGKIRNYTRLPVLRQTRKVLELGDDGYQVALMSSSGEIIVHH